MTFLTKGLHFIFIMTDSARFGFLTRSQRKHGAEAEVKWAAQGAERRARRANSASANQRPERRFQELLAAATTGRQRKWRSRRAQFQKLCLFWTAFNSTTKNLSKSLTRRGRKIRKNLRCSLTWFCRLSAKNSLPVRIFESATASKEKKKKI